jgi:hypothetical protein
MRRGSVQANPIPSRAAEQLIRSAGVSSAKLGMCLGVVYPHCELDVPFPLPSSQPRLECQDSRRLRYLNDFSASAKGAVAPSNSARNSGPSAVITPMPVG